MARAFRSALQELFPSYKPLNTLKMNEPRVVQEAYGRGKKAIPEGRTQSRAAELLNDVLDETPEQAAPGPVPGKTVIPEPDAPQIPTDPAVAADPALAPDVQADAPTVLSEAQDAALPGPTPEQIAQPLDATPERRTRERNINTDFLEVESVDDIVRVLDRNAEQYGERPVESFGDIEADVGGNEKEILKGVINGPPDAAWNSRQLLAARRVLETLVEDQLALATKITDGKGTSEDRVKFELLSEQASMLQNIVQGKRAEAARALNSQKITVQALNTQGVEAVIAAGGSETLNARANAIIDAHKAGKSTADILEASETMTRLKKWATVAMDYRGAAMLTSPRTLFVNLISTALYGAVRASIIRPVAGGAGRLRTMAGLGPDERAYSREAIAEMMGVIYGLRSSILQLGDSMKTGWKNGAEYESFFGEESKADMLLEPGEAPGFIRRGLRHMSYGPLTATDDAQKILAYNGALFANLYRQARDAGIEINSPEWEKFVLENYENISFDAHAQANKEAHQRTFTDRDTTTMLGKLARGALAFSRDYPIFRQIVPYISTPTSLADKVIRMGPGALATPTFWRRLNSPDGAERDTAMAELMVGAYGTYLGYSLAASATITGNGPNQADDPTGAIRRSLLASGWQPDSARIGDTYISLKRMMPITTVVVAGARAYEASLYSKREEDAVDLFVSTAAHTAQLFSEMTMVKGVYEVLNAVFDPSRAAYTIESNVTSYVPNIVKDFAKAFNAVNDQGHPITPKYDSTIDRILAGTERAIPGTTPRMIARYWDATPKTNGGGWGTTINNIITPFMSSQVMDSGGRAKDKSTEALIRARVGPPNMTTDYTVIPKSGASVDLLDFPNGHVLAEQMIVEVGKARRLFVQTFVESKDYQEAVEMNLAGPNSNVAMKLSQLLMKGRAAGMVQFAKNLQEMPDSAWEEFGGQETRDVLTGAELEVLYEYYTEGVAGPEEMEKLLDYGVRGVQSRGNLEVPKGSGSAREKRYDEDTKGIDLGDGGPIWEPDI